MPLGSIFNKFNEINAEVTEVGIQYTGYSKKDCQSVAVLEQIFYLVELYDYDTIWNKKWDSPTNTLAASSDNTFCN